MFVKGEVLSIPVILLLLFVLWVLLTNIGHPARPHNRNVVLLKFWRPTPSSRQMDRYIDADHFPHHVTAYT